MFLNHLRTIARPDGKFELLNDLHYRTATGELVIVPRGFLTDYASVPWYGRWLVPKVGRYNRASVVHDYLVTESGKEWKESNRIFLEAMKADKVRLWRQVVIYLAVELYRITGF